MKLIAIVFARDQFLESCRRELYIHLKAKTFRNLEEMDTEADLFSEARGGVCSSVNKTQRDNIRGSQHKSDSKPTGKPEIKCSICGRGHLTIKDYYRFTFFPRSVIHWNALPSHIPVLPTLAQFSSAVCQVIHVSP